MVVLPTQLMPAKSVTLLGHATITGSCCPSWFLRARPGGRLHTVEIVNWGTFDKLIWRLQAGIRWTELGDYIVGLT
jgi:hypothetical protein